MDFLDPGQHPDVIPVSPAEEIAEKARLEGELAELQKELEQLAPEAHKEREHIQLLMARNLAALERGEEAWPLARAAFDRFLANEDWQSAADACNILYQSDQPDSLAALGQGIWLAVTYPIDPEVTIELLQHLIDDTPKDSDGAAVAAGAPAGGVRCSGKKSPPTTKRKPPAFSTCCRSSGKPASAYTRSIWPAPRTAGNARTPPWDST